jgi:hypothetical protein
MKRFLLALILTSAAIAGFSQKINLGIEAGPNYASQGPDGELMNYGYRHTGIGGFDAGAIVNINLHNFTVQPGLFFITKGEKVPVQQAALPGTPANYIVPENDFTLGYIEASAIALYNVKLVKGLSVHFGAGPYIADGLFITRKAVGKSETGSFSSSNYSIFKNPDIGLGFKGGITFINRILLDAQYGLGIANIGKPGYNIKNRVFGVSVGYLFR